jgi:hypothetical protein
MIHYVLYMLLISVYSVFGCMKWFCKKNPLLFRYYKKLKLFPRKKVFFAFHYKLFGLNSVVYHKHYLDFIYIIMFILKEDINGDSKCSEPKISTFR